MSLLPLRFALLTALFLGSLTATVRVQGGNCGGDRAPSCHAPTTGCHPSCRRHHGHCAPEPARSPRTWLADAPSGPLVESYPMLRSAPTLMMMPMVVGQPYRAMPDEPRSRSGAQCSYSESRLNDLDDRVEALNMRLMSERTTNRIVN